MYAVGAVLAENGKHNLNRYGAPYDWTPPFSDAINRDVQGRRHGRTQALVAGRQGRPGHHHQVPERLTPSAVPGATDESPSREGLSSCPIRRPMTIASAEIFTLVHEFAPRRGPSDAWGSSHAYCLVKLTDADGADGLGRDVPADGDGGHPRGDGGAADRRATLPTARAIWFDIWSSGEQPFATSALSIALDDLRGPPGGRLRRGALRRPAT